jgi:hypothetical protein
MTGAKGPGCEQCVHTRRFVSLCPSLPARGGVGLCGLTAALLLLLCLWPSDLAPLDSALLCFASVFSAAGSGGGARAATMRGRAAGLRRRWEREWVRPRPLSSVSSSVSLPRRGRGAQQRRGQLAVDACNGMREQGGGATYKQGCLPTFERNCSASTRSCLRHTLVDCTGAQKSVGQR